MVAFKDSLDHLISEFEAMDMDADGLLTRQEVSQITIYQGVVLSENEMQHHLRRLGSLVNLSQFVTFMQSLNNSTRKLREIFALFSKDDNRSACESDMLKGLKELGINNAAELVSRMESDNNRVTYKSFLRVYFRAKCCDL